MKDDIKPTPQKRDFNYLDERLNDREPRANEDEKTTKEDEVLKNYPREPINEEVLEKKQVNEVQQRVLAEHDQDAAPKKK